jgi:hypothetical protein
MVRSSEMLVPTYKTLHYVITHNTRIQIPVVIKFKNALKMVTIDSSETSVTTWVTELNAIIIQTTTIQIFTAIKRQMSCVLIPTSFHNRNAIIITVSVGAKYYSEVRKQIHIRTFEYDCCEQFRLSGLHSEELYDSYRQPSSVYWSDV